MIVEYMMKLCMSDNLQVQICIKEICCYEPMQVGFINMKQEYL